MKWYFLVLVALIAFTRADNAIQTTDFTNFNCPDLNSQEEIDLDKIMGKWYVVEILEHKSDPIKHTNGKHVVLDSCPTVHLRSHEYSSLTLLWTEAVGNLEYTFQISDITRRPGFWMSSTLQNGTLTEKKYQQFIGCVHVMKAVASDMVLTFCSRSPGSQLYSLLLSREHTLGQADRRGVHNLLGRRGLKILGIRETCMNGAAGWRRATIDLVASTTLFALLSSVILSRSTQ
ncbi:uncharacterized protein LOC118445860 isoform X1 [Vespa mandarinia]|uniref:uncharacterized protein LOC118445860 isoform X1 n=2 Tax=Vespa mandarinia TaxID=7446 RepID=UPI0016194010|nr:uncharacterized protein LOC118445860 isoform X1 [Vespa mandarinia]XP_035731762.1 uncharacterized protein LOC118445860 isoform X1 [Vespa mandarinia]XP_035731763.1 uncharacterized protein LOC118445860 isoform X1 [Vespa mandarinia]XP_035731764.1 uncharacterized protein LOC118445860 isoform X1 [Vespa mandarinia]XP_035731765.1 uncharacterized protein LOC118445860 isoform X1 [Vespa mandarinia]